MGWGALAKYSWNGKNVATSAASSEVLPVFFTLLMYSSQRDITCRKTRAVLCWLGYEASENKLNSLTLKQTTLQDSVSFCLFHKTHKISFWMRSSGLGKLTILSYL